MRSILSFTVVALFAVSDLHAACGVERWSVKTGTDSMASSVNLSSYVSSTIYNFHQSTRPSSLPSNSRVAPRETTQYRLSATLTKYVRESDSDYHLVIKDSAGRTMIVELPAISCVGAGSPFGPGISHARNQFDARFTATTSFKTTSTPVTLKGVGFWDFLHGQTGVAPNGIEVHPVLDITFGTAATTVDIEEEAAADYEPVWPADMILDDDGGRVRVYRSGDPLGDVRFHGGPVVEDPSIQLLFAGDWSEREMGSAVAATMGLSQDLRIRDLDRYGVRTFGFRVNAGRISMPSGETNDLDVQRALLAEVEAGRIQHVDPDVLYVVLLHPTSNPNLAGNRDWLSYHSQFHPTDLPMRYVVVRGGADRDVQRDALYASVARALVNPASNGWF
jgi:hypothetical protein